MKKKFKVIQILKSQKGAESTEKYRSIEPIEAGNYKLSIQASREHYCTPKETLPVTKYSRFELAIFNKSGAMIGANRSPILKRFKRYRELIACADSLDSSATVYGYVAIDLIEDLYHFLENEK